MPFNGYALLKSGEIAEDLTKYLFDSEQTPSVVALCVLVDKDGSIAVSGGYLFSLFPARAMSSSKRLKITALPCHT